MSLIKRTPRKVMVKVVRHLDSSMIIKKQGLRELGYNNTMTLYGSVFQNGELRYKRVEILSKYPIKQVHNAFLYEVMVNQNLNNPTVREYHAKYPVLNEAKYRGIPKDDYLVMTWNELKDGLYEPEEGDWVEYDQET